MENKNSAYVVWSEIDLKNNGQAKLLGQARELPAGTLKIFIPIFDTPIIDN